jgi:SAM-dependent MidA family methyltransferase
MSDALYGEGGFYRREVPAQHFRTSVEASPLFAGALANLVLTVDQDLGHPRLFHLVDVGAGDGRLLTQLLGAVPGDMRRRVRATAIEIRPRPHGLDSRIEWQTTMPSDVAGVVMAHEYLDNVPCNVVQWEAKRPRQVLVDASGRETLGDDPSGSESAWLDRWWPLSEESPRAEVGVQRDAAWGQIVNALGRGVALSVDYGHVLAERTAGVFPLGTITGYRNGAQVPAVPDGSCDITAHVAMDACAEAGRAAGAELTELIGQRHALQALGVDATRPPPDVASADPQAYLRQLSDASSAAELLDPASLGSFWWLLQSKGISLPIGTVALSG